MLAMHSLLPPTASLLLDHGAHRLRLHARDHGATLKQALVDVRGSLEGVITRAEVDGPIQTEDVARLDVWHLERQADGVTLGYQVGLAVDVDCYVPAWLGG